jgi:hypothetical protein
MLYLVGSWQPGAGISRSRFKVQGYKLVKATVRRVVKGFIGNPATNSPGE